MLESTITALLGGTAIALSIAAAALNSIFAFSLGGNTTTPDALYFLLFIAFGLNVATIIYTSFFAYISFRKINNHAISWSSQFRWRMLAIGVVLSTISVAVSLISLTWLALRVHRLPEKMIQQDSETMFIIWFVIWGISILAQVAMYAFIGRWTKAMQRAKSLGQLDLDFGIRLPPMDEIRSSTNGIRQSFNSQDPTLHSPPRTPTTPISSTRRSSSTRVGLASYRMKSLDFPATLDDWDTSSVHYEIRAALHSSPPVTRSGLATIPGSRSVSPDSPSPHAISSNDFYPSSPPPKQMSSSPPSSPPNFSRPTSRDQNRPLFGSVLEISEDLIHPLFRPTSPRPPPMTIGTGTKITASPMADYPMTPRTLARMRLEKNPPLFQSTASPSRPSSIGSVSGSLGSPGPGSPGPGSPGPSIADEADLPPILPGWVLGAGQRSSLQFYSQRKSVKEKRQSTISQHSRMSSSLR